MIQPEKQIYVDRLTKLVEAHKNEMTQDHFDLNDWFRIKVLKPLQLDKPTPIHISDLYKCGTTACSLGHCPLIFPDDWVLGPDIYDPRPRLKDSTNKIPLPIDDAKDFFGLTYKESVDAFLPETHINRSLYQQTEYLEKLLEKKVQEWQET